MFEKVCVQTEDHRSASDAARAFGFFIAPAPLASAIASTEITDASILIKAYDGAVITLLTGLAPNQRTEFIDEVCAVGVVPGDDTLGVQIEQFLNVGPAQLQSGQPIVWYAKAGTHRVRVEQSTLRGADIIKGMRPRAVLIGAVQTPFGPTHLITQLGTRPK